MPSNVANQAEAGGRSSLSKALALLVIVASHRRQGINLSSAAARAGLHTATAHRLLGMLVDESFLNFDPYTRRYCLGIMPYEIVNRAGQELEFLQFRRQFRPILENVQQKLGGIVSLSVPSGSEALCIDVVEGRSDILLSTLKVGARRPLGAGAASLALLAVQPAELRTVIIAREADRYLKYGQLTAAHVAEACERLPVDGFVLNDALIIPDIGAVAIPVMRAGQPICAVSASNTISRLAPDQRAKIAGTLRYAVEAAGFQTTAPN